MKDLPRRSKAKSQQSKIHLTKMLILNIAVTSVILVSWQTFSSFSLASVGNNSQLKDEIKEEVMRSLTVRGVGGSSEVKDRAPGKASRWEKYRDVYNYKPPDSPFSEPSPLCGAAPDFAAFSNLRQAERSRFLEDEIIYKAFFKNRLTGSGAYVELGAFDGKTESNTRFYDICLGWKGLLIEGNPDTYKQTVVNRPQAHRMSFAPSCKEEGTVQFHAYPMANSGLEGKALVYKGKPTITVPCAPLGRVLEDVFAGETINFFSLDVEGAEPMVLETIDFDKVKIDVIMIEVENASCKRKHNCASRKQVREIMDNLGFERHDFGTLVLASDVYVNPKSTFKFVDSSSKQASDSTTTSMVPLEKYNFMPPSTPFGRPAKECGNAPHFTPFFQLKEKFRSRYDEDRIIYETFFEGKMLGKGTYIELGAFDGITESNTRFFDVCLGWKGLLIEGNPDTYRKTTKNRPQANRMSFAPSCKEQSTVQFYKYPMANSGLEGKAKEYEGKPTVTVPCGPLGPVLEEIFASKGEHINFFSLDVEGAEPMVLETIDFDKVQIDIMMIEVENLHCKEDCESRRQTREIMGRLGWKRYDFGRFVSASDVYVNPKSPYQRTYKKSW